MTIPKVGRSLKSRLRAGRETVDFFCRTPDWDEIIRPELSFGEKTNSKFVSDINSSEIYLEFGSGASTLIASQSAVKRVVSVESDFRFMSAVRSRIDSSNGGPTDFDFLYVDIGTTGPWGAPILKSRVWRRRQLWPAYPVAPWVNLGAGFRADLVLVDGRFRVACALAVITFQQDSSWKLLVDDFAERSEYFPIKDFANLKEMRGRMAVFEPKKDLDVMEAQSALRYFQSDWR